MSELKIREMTVADHHMVGEIGFAAWKSRGAKEVRFHQAHVIERARKAFDYPAAAKGDVAVAELESRIVERAGFLIAWRDEKIDAELGIPLEKVHLEERLG
ncbi:hypothetical protein [Rhizobium mesoamericanum]|uniref:hypothetical protein n=1 Tax=Rhizobium mesoamericanum TaxID=1079800 RepID=UPI001F474039|nr:hypothetical protein [Rhizobium mesoamericanum]